MTDNVNQVKATKDDCCTYPFDYDCVPGFLVPAHIPLHKLGRCIGQDDYTAVAQALKQQKGCTVLEQTEGFNVFLIDRLEFRIDFRIDAGQDLFQLHIRGPQALQSKRNQREELLNK